GDERDAAEVELGVGVDAGGGRQAVAADVDPPLDVVVVGVAAVVAIELGVEAEGEVEPPHRADAGLGAEQADDGAAAAVVRVALVERAVEAERRGDEEVPAAVALAVGEVDAVKAGLHGEEVAALAGGDDEPVLRG